MIAAKEIAWLPKSLLELENNTRGRLVLVWLSGWEEAGKLSQTDIQSR